MSLTNERRETLKVFLAFSGGAIVTMLLILTYLFFAFSG